jgi:hypothetical protein
VAAFITTGFEPSQLISLAKARDEGLGDADFAEAARWVDDSDDRLFAPYLEDQDPGDGEVRDVAWLRRMLETWPRELLHTD